MPKERDILKIIWQNFVKSLRPRPTSGSVVGKDNFGNTFYEIPADPSIGKRKAARWFTPAGKDELSSFDQQMPAEWEAWLRGRRTTPPTEEEVMRNDAIAVMKKQNAAELEAERRGPGVPPPQEKIKDFPTYPEYEIDPGKYKDKPDKS